LECDVSGSGIIRSPEANSSVYGTREVHAVNRGCGLASIAVRISSVLKFIIIRLGEGRTNGADGCGIGAIKFIPAVHQLFTAIGIGRCRL